MEATAVPIDNFWGGTNMASPSPLQEMPDNHHSTSADNAKSNASAYGRRVDLRIALTPHITYQNFAPRSEDENSQYKPSPPIEVWAAMIEQEAARQQDVSAESSMAQKTDLLALIVHASKFLELEAAAAQRHGYPLTLEDIHEVLDAFNMSDHDHCARARALPIIMATASTNLRQVYLNALGTGGTASTLAPPSPLATCKK
jgi:hypothetical protein